MNNNFNNAMNPMTYWQQTMSHWMPGPACLPTSVKPDAPSATSEPFAFGAMSSNPMEAWQQGMQMWQQMFFPQAGQPQQPATPKITFDLGDVKPFMDAAMQMGMQWQQMWMKGMGGK